MEYKKTKGKEATVAGWIGGEHLPSQDSHGAYRYLEVDIHRPPRRRCFTCQIWSQVIGFRNAKLPRCGMCAGPHSTLVCNNKLAQGEFVQENCINSDQLITEVITEIQRNMKEIQNSKGTNRLEKCKMKPQ